MKPLVVPNGSGARHAGRAGYRFGILGPTEAGKTTLAVRIIEDWMKQNPKLPVWSNIRFFVPKAPDDPQYQKIPHPQVNIYKSPLKWKQYRNGLLFVDEFSEYINSIPDITSGKMLKTLIHLAKNLMKQDMEFLYTDQHALSLHKRVRINVNRVYAPSFEPAFDTVTYMIFDSIDEYIDFKENPMSRLATRIKPFKFHASEYYPFFNTREIVTPKEFHFIPEREVEKLVGWFSKKGQQLTSETITDAIAYYQEKQNLDWTSKQERAVRFLLKRLFAKEDGEEA